MALHASRARHTVFFLICSAILAGHGGPSAAQGGSCTAPPVAIAVGQNLDGTLSWDDCIDAATGYPYDRYTFEAEAGRHYTVGFNSKPLFASMKVLDPSGAVAATGVSEHFYRTRATFQAAVSGTYTIVGSGSGPQANVPSNYQVWVRDDDAPCDATETPIAPGETLSGELRVTDCYGQQMDDAFTDLYTFTGVVGGEYTITMRSEDVDALLALKGPNGAVITWSNNGGGGLDAQLVYRPTVPGTYTIEASAYDLVSRSLDGFGAYTVSLASYFCGSQTAEIAPGQTLSGELSTTDCPSPHRPQFFDHYHDTFTFAATAGVSYEIVLSADDYDPYLYLLDPSGAVVAENNDGGGGWNSRILYTPVSSGVFTIEVTSYYYHQTGPYTVSLAVATPCSSTNAAIAPGQSVGGELSFTDCYSATNPDAFYDRYTFAAAAGTEYTVAVTTDVFDLYVELRDPAGRVVRTEGRPYTTRTVVFYYAPYTSGTYTLDVSSLRASETGAYTVTLLADGNSACTTTTSPIVPDEPATGELAIADCYGTLRDHAYHDRYTFSGSAGAEFTITMNSEAFDTFLGLYGPDGALVDSNDDGGDVLNSKIEVVLPATGEYTIEATSYWSTATGPYQLLLEEGIDVCTSSVVHVTPGEAAEASLDFSDCYGAYYPSSFADVFTFDVVPGTTYIIRMSCPVYSLDPTIALFNGSGSLLATDDNSGPGLDARILFTSGVTDTMRVEAAATHLGSRTGPYTFSVAVYNGENDCVPPATPIAAGQTLEGTLTEEDCYSPNRPFTYHDRFTFEASPDMQYTIDMSSDSLDAWLILLDPEGNVLEQDDDGGFLGPRIVFTPSEAGTYTLEATTYLPETSGAYSVSLAAEQAPEQRGGCVAPVPIKIDPGQSISNSLTTLDCRPAERPASHHDRYALVTTAGARYVVSMESGEVDAYLLLLDPSGAVAAENNDDAGKLDAKIDFVADSAGAYTILATTNQGDVTGRYSLAVEGHEADTVGVYAAAGGDWFLRETNTPGPADVHFIFGPAGAALVPLAGDWNGDGGATAALYSPASGTFFLRDAHAPGVADTTFSFGLGGLGYVPLAGDWDGDGADTVGLYAPSSGTFFLRNAHAPGAADVTFPFGVGGAGYVPITGDWDGDGTDTVGLYHPASGTFFLRNAHAPGAADHVFTFGVGGAGYVPLAGDWNADGVDTVGLYDPATGVFWLRDEHAGGPADLSVVYGPPNATPVTGAWRGR